MSTAEDRQLLAVPKFEAAVCDPAPASVVAVVARYEAERRQRRRARPVIEAVQKEIARARGRSDP